MTYFLLLMLTLSALIVLESYDIEEKSDFASTYSLFPYSYEPVSCSNASSTKDLLQFVKGKTFPFNSPPFLFKKNWFELLPEKLQECAYWINGKFIKKSETNIVVSHPMCYTKEKLNEIKNSSNTSALIDTCQGEFPRGLSFSNPLDLYHQKPSTVPQQFYDMSSIPLGKVLVFSGNSLSRQLLMRLIFFIRKIPFVIEHYTHRSMWYAFDHEKDFLYIEPSQVEISLNRSRYMEIKEEVKARGFVEGSYTLLIMSFPIDDCKKVMTEIKTFADGLSCQLPLWPFRKGVPVPMHWRFYKFNKENNVDKTFEKMDLLAYNYYVHQNLTFERKIKYTFQNRDYKKPERNMNCIMKGKVHSRCVSNVLIFSDTHFMCGFELQYPEAIKFVKFPPNGDCTDTVNLNTVQRFLSFLFDKRV